MMKQKILIVVLIISILLGTGYAITRRRLPEWTVTHMMAQLEDMDFDALELDFSENQEELLRDLLEKVLADFSYEITDSRIEGRMAYVTVNLTMIDLPRLVIDNYQILLGNLWTNIDLSSIFGILMGDGIEQVVMQELLNLLDDESIEVTLGIREVEIPLERSGLRWNPILTYEWLLSTLGLDDMVSELLNDLFNLFN